MLCEISLSEATSVYLQVSVKILQQNKILKDFNKCENIKKYENFLQKVEITNIRYAYC